MEPKGLYRIIRKAQLIDDINTAIQKAEGQMGVEKPNSGPSSSKTASKTQEVIPTRTVTLSKKALMSVQGSETSQATKKETPFKKLKKAEY